MGVAVAKILLIDDSPEILSQLSEFLTLEGHDVDVARDGGDGISRIEKESYEVVLSDLRMPGVDGLAVLGYVVEHFPSIVCIILTGHGSIKNAVEAIKAGAFDYLTKPVKFDEIRIALMRALEYRNLKKENLQLKQQLRKKYRFENLIGDSPAIQRVFETIEKVADTDSTVLILGESGTGKELIAKALHFNSSRREGPFIPVNCAAIPGELLESELFGHEKGAFTNAIRTRIGRVEMAGGGTLFLDEIGDMSTNLQSKLLRVLQEREFERIGGMKTIKTDMRVIAATHRDLKREVEEKKFREDLYYRLHVIPIEVPPLRDRRSDIPLLVHHFIDHFNRNRKKKIEGIDDDALQLLMNSDWPGNVRELENTVERIVILSGGDRLTAQDLPEKYHAALPHPTHAAPVLPEAGISLDAVVSDFEKTLILEALNKTGWVKNKAAQLLNLNRTTLIEKIKRQNLERPGQ
jgi:DNA-binding NtrC family response regulator